MPVRSGMFADVSVQCGMLAPVRGPSSLPAPRATTHSTRDWRETCITHSRMNSCEAMQRECQPWIARGRNLSRKRRIWCSEFPPGLTFPFSHQ